MTMSSINYKEKAADEAKKGGDIERAKVYAILALVQALEDNTEEIRCIGAEAWPIHVEVANILDAKPTRSGSGPTVSEAVDNAKKGR